MKNSLLQNFTKNIHSHGVIFVDLDGTLIYTDMANTKAYLKAIDELCIYNYPIHNQKIFKRITKKTLKNFGIKYKKIEQIVKLKKEIYPKFLHETKINIELINFIKNYYKKYRFYIVSSGDYHRIYQTIEYHKISYLFRDIICKESDKYAYAVKFLNINYIDIFIFENCEKEINNAISIGIQPSHIFQIR